MARTSAPLTTATTRPPVVRTEGQRMLLAVTGSLQAIASELGCRSPQTVANWKAGEKLPSESSRARMWTAFGIPPRAWTVLPGGGALTRFGGVDAEPTVPATSRPASTLEHTLELLDLSRRHRSQEGLVASEIAKYVDTEAKLIQLRARLETAAEFAEARYVLQHPSWIKLRRAILKALEPHPLAAKAVADALAEFE